MKPKPYVGQTLYRLSIGNAARRGGGSLVPVTVTKVGLKYFTTLREGWEETEFYLENWHQHTDYSPDYCLYETEREYEEEKERNRIHRDLREAFGTFSTLKLSLSDLREIKAILDRSSPPPGLPPP